MRKTTTWINQKFNSTLKDSDFNHIKDFLLLWNLFESKIYHNNFSINEVEGKIQQSLHNVNQDIVDSTYQYFRKRYVADGVHWNNLNFRPNDRKQLVRDILDEENSSNERKILSSTIIIYRYRNNLFHGLKDITTINYQKDNFITANKFLMMFIDAYPL